MPYFKLFPEVPGHINAQTFDFTTNTPKTDPIEYVFDGWPADDILKTSPIFLVSEQLKVQLEEENLTGCEFADLKISVSDQFMHFHSDLLNSLPSFYWLKIDGIAGKDDFGLSSERKLIVSDLALTVIYQFNMSDCEIEAYTPGD